jgi:hypothetical protein
MSGLNRNEAIKTIDIRHLNIFENNDKRVNPNRSAGVFFVVISIKARGYNMPVSNDTTIGTKVCNFTLISTYNNIILKCQNESKWERDEQRC